MRNAGWILRLFSYPDARKLSGIFHLLEISAGFGLAVKLYPAVPLERYFFQTITGKVHHLNKIPYYCTAATFHMRERILWALPCYQGFNEYLWRQTAPMARNLSPNLKENKLSAILYVCLMGSHLVTQNSSPLLQSYMIMSPLYGSSFICIQIKTERIIHVHMRG